MMPIAVVVRPGETEYDQQDRVQGTLDLPLSERGERQIDEIIAALRSQSIRQIYTSPGEPALSTAHRVGAALGVAVKEADGLLNVDHGLWQGLCIDEIRRKHPRVFRQWSESPESVCPPGGETCEEAFVRAQKALRKPMKRKDNFAVVCSEPMATLVESVLRHEHPRLSSPCDRDHRSHINVIEFTKPETVAIAD